MTKTLIPLLTSTLLISGCNIPTQPKQTTKEKHIQTGNELEMIMGQFNGLTLQAFINEREREKQRTHYTQQITTLVDQLAQNSKELEAYAQNESELFIQYADELAQDAQKLKIVLADQNSSEEITPTLQSIERLCYQCHATLHE